MPGSAETRNLREVQYLKEIHRQIPQLNVQKPMSAKVVALDIGWESEGYASRYASRFEEIGLISRDIKMSPEGKISLWQINQPLDEALQILYKDQDARTTETNRKRSEARTRVRLPEETVSITGPDAPTLVEAMPQSVRDLRKDEPGALIAAARQYANRNLTVETKLKELAATMNELGIAFDIEKAKESFHFDYDERLEMIALVLPVIDRLERQNTTLAGQVADHREKVRDYDRMKGENDRLVRRVENLVSQQVTLHQ